MSEIAEWRGRHFLIVGGSRGLGYAVVSALVRRGADVTVIARTPDRLRQAAEAWDQIGGSGMVRPIALDMSEEMSIASLQKFLGINQPLHGLVVCAGSGRPVAGARLSRMAAMVAANIAPLLNSLDATEELLKTSTDASVVVASSIAGRERISCPPEYAAAKAAVDALVSHLAVSLRPVRVNSVLPGNMLTDGSVWKRMAEEEPGKLKTFLETDVPLERVGDPREVAEVVLFLLSAASSFVTGAAIVADGGQSRSFP